MILISISDVVSQWKLGNILFDKKESMRTTCLKKKGCNVVE